MKNEAELVGYYYFKKRLPREGWAIYFSWSSDPYPSYESIGMRYGENIFYDDYKNDGMKISRKSVPIDLIDKKWRYVTFSLASEPEHGIFDDTRIYHLADKQLPEEGQYCYFLSLSGYPKKFAHEALAHEHYGIHVDGEFYKLDSFANQDYPYGWENKPWPQAQKAPGAIY